METASAALRHRIKMSDSDIVQHFKRLGFSVEIDAVHFTIESVEDFFAARQRLWHRPGELERYEQHGLMVVVQAQPKPNQPTRDIAVVSLGHARAVVGVMPGMQTDAEHPRYAATMG